mmetsp:Transcript_23952/g.57094  ORF Transcript_23952/g.57094 Transcript_23952/m.57094 type:complete len:225 (-) Transcript_23952:135-809(-)
MLGSRVYAVVARGAGGGNRVVGAHEADVHGEHRGPHVGDRKRDAERVHLPVAMLHQCRDGVGKDVHAAHGRPDQDTAFELVQVVDLRAVPWQPCVSQSLLSGNDRALEAVVHAACHLLGHIPFGLDCLELAGDPRRETVGVEALDARDAAPAVEEVGVELLVRLPERADDTEARHHHPRPLAVEGRLGGRADHHHALLPQLSRARRSESGEALGPASLFSLMEF